MDELRTVDPSDSNVVLTGALRILIAPLFPAVDMNAAALFAGFRLSAGGIDGVSVALYKAVNPGMKARKSFTLDAARNFSRGTVEWRRVGIGPFIETDSTSNFTRIFWMFNKEIEIRVPDIYGAAFMVDNTNAILQGSSSSGSIHTAFMDSITRSSIIDYPEFLSVNQAARASMPAVVLRSARALSWIGG